MAVTCVLSGTTTSWATAGATIRSDSTAVAARAVKSLILLIDSLIPFAFHCDPYRRRLGPCTCGAAANAGSRARGMHPEAQPTNGPWCRARGS